MDPTNVQIVSRLNLIENAIKKFDNLEKIVRHQTDNYNLKTKVDTLDKNMKALAGKVEDKSSADSILAKTLENEIKQDLRQEMGNDRYYNSSTLF